MVGEVPLLDAIASVSFSSDGERPDELQLRLANQMVAAALQQHEYVESLDLCGRDKKWRRLYVRETETEMRRMHERWPADAMPLFERVREMRRSGSQIDRFADFEKAVLSTKVLLTINLSEIERGLEEIRNGNYVTIAEARRELRVSVDIKAARTVTELPFDVQEHLWDLLDQIANDPSSPNAVQGLSGAVHLSFTRRPIGR